MFRETNDHFPAPPQQKKFFSFPKYYAVFNRPSIPCWLAAEHIQDPESIPLYASFHAKWKSCSVNLGHIGAVHY